MAFDPDAYLAKSPAPSGGFDPDAYLGVRPSPAPPPKPSLGQRFMQGIGDISSAPEVVANFATGALGQAVGGWAGIGASLLPGEEGQGARVSEKVAHALTYQPRNQAAKKALGLLGEGMEYVNTKLGDIGESISGNAGRTIFESALPVAMTVAPLPKVIKNIRANPEFTALPKSRKSQSGIPVRDETTGEITYYSPEEVRYARENAPLLEAGQLAQDMGIKINPARTNPTKQNLRLASRATEKHLDAALAKANEQIWNNAIAEEMGVDPTIARGHGFTPEVIGQVRENASVPMRAIAEQGGFMAPTADHLAAIKDLRRTSTIASPEIAGQTSGLIDRALTTVESGADAGTLLREIADLRSDAKKFYETTGGGPEMAEKARTYKKLANILEDMVQQNLETLARTDPYGQFAEMAKAYPEARTKMAQSYVVEHATDFNTGKIDPTKLAKMTAEDNALTGRFRDVGKVVGNLPETAVATAREPGFFETRYSRASAPALFGALGGALLPIPGGMATGSILGMTAGELLGRQATKKLMSPEGQAGALNRVPRSLWDLSDQDPLISRYNFDREPITREFVPPMGGEPPMLPPPAPPAGPRGPIEGAPAPYRHPNFQFGENNPPQPAPPGTAMTRGEPLTPEQQWAQDKANFAAQDRTRYNREAALDALAAQKAEAEAAALRKPAGEGTIIGGGDQPAPVRMEPLVITPTALQSAVDKIAKGRAFDLTAEERIAWSKASGTIEMLRNVKE